MSVLSSLKYQNAHDEYTHASGGWGGGVFHPFLPVTRLVLLLVLNSSSTSNNINNNYDNIN